jgi:hypothetical protein
MTMSHQASGSSKKSPGTSVKLKFMGDSYLDIGAP